MNDYHSNRLVANLDALKSVLEGVKYYGGATDSEIHKVEEMVAILEEYAPKEELPDLEVGQYCIVFIDGDTLVVDSEGVVVGSDPDCPNRFDGVYNTISKITTKWSRVKVQVDNGVCFGTGYEKAEIDNQVSGTIQRIVRGTL